MIVNVLKYKDLSVIEQFLRDGGYDNGNIEIVMYIETQERLNRLNEEYFHIVNGEGVPYENTEVKELNINIGNVRFKYKLKNLND